MVHLTRRRFTAFYLTSIWNKEKAMTSSPCKNCPKRFKSKFECAKDCKILRQVQEMQSSLQEQNIFSAIDYAEEGRFSINYNNNYSIP